MEGLKRLSYLLDRQLEIQNKLLELENEKTTVLLKGDIEQLDNIVNLEQPLIMNSNNFERQRECLQSKIDLEDVTLREIISKHPSFNNNLLETQYTQLKNIIAEIKKINSTNQKILNSRLSVINFVLMKTGLMEDVPITYKKR